MVIVIGIDLGLKEFAVCSNGDRFDNPKNLRKYEKKLAKLQKDLSKKSTKEVITDIKQD